MSQEIWFPIPLGYLDLVRRTHTTLTKSKKVRLMIVGIVDGGWLLSGPWTELTQFTLFNTTPPKTIHLVWRGIDEDSSDVQTLAHLVRNLFKYVKEISAKRKTKSELTENRRSTTRGSWEEYITWIWKTKNSMKHWKTRDTYWRSTCTLLCRSSYEWLREFILEGVHGPRWGKSWWARARRNL